jgi:hypothetical protein
MVAMCATEADEQELPEDMVSAWATVLLDIHERDRRDATPVAAQEIAPQPESSSCPSC